MSDHQDNHNVLPALCLDFDGTIRHPKRGKIINRPEDVALFPGVEDKIWDYKEAGFLVFGITNQGGVAYGYKTLADWQAELDQTVALFTRNPFDYIAYSLLHPGGRVAPYNHRSLLRKPEVGMLAMCEVEMFQRGVVVDWDRSIFVGDRPEDEECAQRAGLTFIHADTFFGRG
jgi:D-glycero-D-manno-heptose 1,7-bisphosphate phosphatase